MSGVSGAEVRVGGTKLDDAIGQKLVEARIQENLRLPDACLLRFSDPGLEKIDQFPIQIGSDIEVLLSAIDGTSLTSTFKGKVVSLEPEFASGTTLGFRAYDGSHQLHQTKTAATYQNMTASDIARKVAGRAGIDVGTVDSGGVAYDFIQQNNETDWEFLWKLASRIDFEVLVLDHKLYFRKAGPPAGTQDISLKWGDTLISFNPRISGVQQVDEVTVRARNGQQAQPYEATTSLQEPESAIGISRAAAAGALSGGTMVVADRPVHSQAEAQDLSDAYASHMGAGYLEAHGVAKGNPAIKAGSKVKIDGVGTSFGGTYVVSSCVHHFQGSHGYRTLFSTSGRSPRSLVDLMTPKGKRGWGNSVVMGIVTNNNDPDNTGRVRVKYPALGDQTEGWWAPVVAPNAGSSRGLLMLPQVGDEVVIGFEHDDVQHPYVLGSIWNGAATPGSDLALQDGSFSLQSDQKIAMHAKDVITIKSDKDFSLETTGKIDQKPQQDMTLDGAASVTIKGGTTISIEGTTQLEIKCGSSSLTMNSMGVISISGTQISLG
ncbi:MAG TPA: VgrG-related protein [Gaiellaceae bacterium]|jgi:phage protein D|nr:VgrG-related protein [Gaiellaceae bacterium]